MKKPFFSLSFENFLPTCTLCFPQRSRLLLGNSLRLFVRKEAEKANTAVCSEITFISLGLNSFTIATSLLFNVSQISTIKSDSKLFVKYIKFFSYPVTDEHFTLRSGFHNICHFGMHILLWLFFLIGLSSPISNIMKTRDGTKYNRKRINSSCLDFTAPVTKVINYWKNSPNVDF